MAQVDLKKVRRLRRAKDITQEEMAAHLGYKAGSGYLYLEKGRCQIRADQLSIIAKVLEVPIEDLYVSEPDNMSGKATGTDGGD